MQYVDFYTLYGILRNIWYFMQYKVFYATYGILCNTLSSDAYVKFDCIRDKFYILKVLYIDVLQLYSFLNIVPCDSLFCLMIFKIYGRLHQQ